MGSKPCSFNCVDFSFNNEIICDTKSRFSASFNLAIIDGKPPIWSGSVGVVTPEEARNEVNKK